MAVEVTEVGRPAVTSAGRTVPPFGRRQRGLAVVGAAMVALVVVCWLHVHFGFLRLFDGIGRIFTFLGDTLPPSFSQPNYPFTDLLDDALVTVCMALVGTALAVVLSVPLGFLAARNTTPHPVVRHVCRAVVALCRAMPALVLAIVFRDALGIGVLPGVLALGIHSVGMLGKVYADGVEQVPAGPREAMAAVGASRLQTLATAVLPPALPTLTSTALYRLDINLRESVILGYVGAGGIGFTLQADLNTLHFKEGLGIVVVIAVLCLLMELVSASLRAALIGAAGSGRPGVGDRILLALTRRRRAGEDGGGTPEQGPGFDRQRVRRALTPTLAMNRAVPVLTIGLVVAAYVKSHIPGNELVHAPAKVWDALGSYFPPDFTTNGSALWHGMIDSAAIAVVGTALGALVSIPVALLAARNIANKWVYLVVRFVLVVERSIPELIMAIVFVVALGPGPVAGVFALVGGTLGFLAKLLADSLEQVPEGPRLAVRAAGAGPVQETATGVIPAAMPSLVGHVLYMLDINFRASTVLGIVGAGGIGFLLSQSVQTLAYQTTSAIIVSSFVVVLAIEQLANWLRKQLI